MWLGARCGAITANRLPFSPRARASPPDGCCRCGDDGGPQARARVQGDARRACGRRVKEGASLLRAPRARITLPQSPRARTRARTRVSRRPRARARARRSHRGGLDTPRASSRAPREDEGDPTPPSLRAPRRPSSPPRRTARRRAAAAAAAAAATRTQTCGSASRSTAARSSRTWASRAASSPHRCAARSPTWGPTARWRARTASFRRPRARSSRRSSAAPPPRSAASASRR